MAPRRARLDFESLPPDGVTGGDRGARDPRRSKLNPQACNHCRQFKAKCDGGRPTCLQCLSRGRDCEYTGAPGQTRYQALQSRLLAFENIYQSLQTGSPSDAASLLERIRASNLPGLVSLLGSDSDATEVGPSGPSFFASPSVTDVTRSGASEPSLSRSPSLIPHLPAIQIPSFGTEELGRGILGFFESSGRLFHAFSLAQVDQLHLDAKDAISGPSRRRAQCCLSAVAAVGFFYIDETNDSWEAARPVYHYAKYLFEDLVQHFPLDALKVSMLMAMFNIMNNDMVALKYIEFGMTLSAQHGIDLPYRDESISQEQWSDCRRVWRTFVFFSSWLTSTLGYTITRSILTQPPSELYGIKTDPYAPLSEVVQTELTKVAILEGKVLYIHSRGRTVSDAALMSLATDLRDWYSHLPTDLRLTNLGLPELSPDIRHDIFYLHLLHLGVIMLHFRCIATHARPSVTEPFRKSDELNLAAVKSFVPDAATAAMQSARILALLLESRGLSKKCWLVVYQAYTSCTTLLYFTIQKRLHFGDLNTAQEELKRARFCLDALTFTGSYDGLRTKFYRTLSGHYETITGFPHTSEHYVNDPDTNMLELQEVGPPKPTPQFELDQTFTIPPDSGAKLAEVSRSLLDLLRLPFGGESNAPDEQSNFTVL